jgi:hypothetical protein
MDSKAEDVLKRAIDSIKDNEHIGYKHKKKILNGIVQFNSSTNATTMHNKPTIMTSTRVTPRKTLKDTTNAKRMTTNSTVKFRRTRTNRRGRGRTNRRGRGRS